MMRKKSIKQNSLWTLLGNGAFFFCQWANIVILAKLSNAETVGQFAYALAITAPIFEFTNLQLRGIQATDAKNEYTFEDYLGLRIVMLITAFFILVLVCIFLNYNIEFIFLLLSVALTKVLDGMSDIVYGLLLKFENTKDMAFSLIFRGVGALILLSIMFFFSRRLVFGVIGIIISWSIIFYFYDLRKTKKILKQYNLSKRSEKSTFYLCQIRPNLTIFKLKELFFLSLPMGGVMMLSSLSQNIPRYFVENKLGLDKLGYFAAIYYISRAGTMIISSVGKTASPRLALYYAKKEFDKFKYLLYKLLLFALVLGFIGITISLAFGDIILSLVYSPEYIAYKNIFVWLMIFTFFTYIVNFLGNGVTSMRIFKTQFLIHFLNVMVTFLSSFFLIDYFGLVGAVWSLLAEMLFMTILYAALIYFNLKKVSYFCKDSTE